MSAVGSLELTLNSMLTGAPQPIKERKEEIMWIDGLQEAVPGGLHARGAE